jgi:putative membrane protein (TIGR04086 family)
MSVQESPAVSAGPAIRWLRVVLAGFLAEVVLVGVAVPLYFLPNRQQALNIAIPPASFVVLAAFGWWVGRSAPRAPVLNGFLAGTVGVVLYLVLVLVGAVATHTDPLASLTPAYLLAHALKMAGGATGGWLAGRK